MANFGFLDGLSFCEKSIFIPIDSEVGQGAGWESHSCDEDSRDIDGSVFAEGSVDNNSSSSPWGFWFQGGIYGFEHKVLGR